MNPVAQHALAKARQTVAPARKPAPVPKLAPVKAVPAKARIAIAGEPARPKHYDHIGFLEGKRDATDLVISMTGTLRMPDGIQQVINKLKSSATGRPASQALGVWSIIEVLEAA